MDYNFNERIDRSNTNSLKWEMLPEDGNPMWVADMDFQTAPAIRKAVEERAAHGVFGYSILPEEWAASYRSWWKNRYGLAIEKEWLTVALGVIPAINTAIRRFTMPAEKILVQTPVYNMFFHCIRSNGRQVLENELIYEDGLYRMDFDDLERKLADPLCTMMLLCSPQNPTGTIWSKDDLARVGELAERHHVLVVADEIHCDLTDPGKVYTPYVLASEACRQGSIVTLAPSKSFNIAGLSSAAVMVCDEGLRTRMQRAMSAEGTSDYNAFSVQATIAAYTQSGGWLDALREYIFENKRVVIAFLRNNLPQIRLVPSEATYLLWLDCSKLDESDSEILAGQLLAKTGLRLNAGYTYGECGRRFLRMNIACPREQLIDGLNRLKEGVRK